MKIFITFILLVTAGLATAEGVHINNLTISKIRAVGDYPGNTYDDSIELWFTTTLVWPDNMECTAGYRVYIDASKAHLISAAYAAQMAGKKVNIYADDSLTVRNGSCELAYLDIQS